MLQSASESIGTVPIIVGFLVLFSTVLYGQYLRQKSVKTGQCELEKLLVPQSISTPIPFFGHVIGYVRNGHSYFSNLCFSTTLPVFNIRMAKINVSLVKPALTRHLPKVKHLSLNPLVLELLRRGLDLGESSSALLEEKDDLSRQFGPEVSRLWREEFIPNHKLRGYIEELDRYIEGDVAELKSTETIHLEDWVFKTLVGALGKALWGGDDGPFSEPEFVQKLRTLLLNIQRLNNPAKFMIDKKLLESRQFVRDRFAKLSFEEYAGRCVGGASSGAADQSFLGRVRKLCLNHGAVAEGWTDYQLLLIAGLGPNVMAAATWMLHHILSDSARYAKIKEEIEAFVAKSKSSIDLIEMSEACPLLNATWFESLRFHGGFALGRYVHEDTTLAGKYALTKGSYVLASLGPHHYDRQIWGPDVDAFHPERFLMAEGGFDESQKKKLRIYGLFVRLLMGFDLVPLNGVHVVPDECKEAVAGLSTPAWDVEVGVRERTISKPSTSNASTIKIRFKGTSQPI